MDASSLISAKVMFLEMLAAQAREFLRENGLDGQFIEKFLAMNAAQSGEAKHAIESIIRSTDPAKLASQNSPMEQSSWNPTMNNSNNGSRYASPLNAMNSMVMMSPGSGLATAGYSPVASPGHSLSKNALWALSPGSERSSPASDLPMPNFSYTPASASPSYAPGSASQKFASLSQPRNNLPQMNLTPTMGSFRSPTQNAVSMLPLGTPALASMFSAPPLVQEVKSPRYSSQLPQASARSGTSPTPAEVAAFASSIRSPQDTMSPYQQSSQSSGLRRTASREAMDAASAAMRGVQSQNALAMLTQVSGQSSMQQPSAYTTGLPGFSVQPANNSGLPGFPSVQYPTQQSPRLTRTASQAARDTNSLYAQTPKMFPSVNALPQPSPYL
jgi:hypothetical protein